MALSKIVKLAMKGATKSKKLPRQPLDVPNNIKDRMEKELPLEKNTTQKEFLEERTISGMDIDDVRKGGLPPIAANLTGFLDSNQPALLKFKRNQELSGFNKYIDDTEAGMSPFVDLNSIKAIKNAGADITMSDVKKYMELQKKYRPNYNTNPKVKREKGRVVSVEYELVDGLTPLEWKQLTKINNKMVAIDRPIREKAALTRLANLTDQQLFVDAKGMKDVHDDFGLEFDIEDYISETMSKRQVAIEELERMGAVRPVSDLIERVEPGPSVVPTPANERKKGGSVIERNPYGDNTRLI